MYNKSTAKMFTYSTLHDIQYSKDVHTFTQQLLYLW